MGLFERLGRKAERLKQEAKDAREQKVSQRCRSCGATLYDEHETCPECASEDVVAVED